MKNDIDEVINIAFELVFIAKDWPSFQNKSREEIEKWVRDQFEKSGYPTIPIGSKWSRLVTKEEFNNYYGKSKE